MAMVTATATLTGIARVPLTPRAISKRTYGIWLVGIVLAIMSAMAALAPVGATRAPLLATSMVPENGRAHAEAADLLLKQEIMARNGEMPEAIPFRSVAFANRAFVTEPLAVEALRIIALDRESRGKLDEARAIMRLLPNLSKREGPANLWLSQDYGRLGLEEEAFSYFDMTLRVSESSAPLVIPPLVQGLEQDKLIAPLAELLRVNPPWAEDFWLEVGRRPQIAEPAARLRMMMGREYFTKLGKDRSLITNLVRRGKIDEALVLYRYLTGQKLSRDLEFEFASSPKYPPFDWQLLSEGNFSSSIEPDMAQLHVSAAPGSSGVVARRMLSLEPGSYRVSINFQATMERDVGVEVALRCAEESGETWRTLSFAQQSSATQTIGPVGACPYHFLEVSYQNESRIDAVDLAISSISLQKVD